MNFNHISSQKIRVSSLALIMLLATSLSHINIADAGILNQPDSGSIIAESVAVPMTADDIGQTGPTASQLNSPIQLSSVKLKEIKNSPEIGTKKVTAAVTIKPEDFSLPSRLIIPDINVDTAVGYVGLDPDGAMYISKNEDNAVWYELGTRPGESGSAVMAGHFERENGRISVFDNLYKLRIGDKIYVTAKDGSTTIFVVHESRIIDRQTDASDIFFSHDGLSHLNIITCNGNWDKIAKTYNQRLVIFADKE